LWIALRLAQRSLARLSGHVIAARANPGATGRARRPSSIAPGAIVLQGRYMGYCGKGTRAAIARARELAKV